MTRMAGHNVTACSVDCVMCVSRLSLITLQWNLVSWCFEPSQPQRINQGWKQTSSTQVMNNKQIDGIPKWPSCHDVAQHNLEEEMISQHNGWVIWSTVTLCCNHKHSSEISECCMCTSVLQCIFFFGLVKIEIDQVYIICNICNRLEMGITPVFS